MDVERVEEAPPARKVDHVTQARLGGRQHAHGPPYLANLLGHALHGRHWQAPKTFRHAARAM